jgi:hypothetical protein
MLESSKAHLEDVQESYLQHLAAALLISARLAKASIACAAHAIVPGVCDRTASRCVEQIHHSIIKRRKALGG